MSMLACASPKSSTRALSHSAIATSRLRHAFARWRCVFLSSHRAREDVTKGRRGMVPGRQKGGACFRGYTHPLAKHRLRAETRQQCSERAPTAIKEKRTVTVSDDLGDGAYARRDYRYTCVQRLRKHHPIALERRRQDERIGKRELARQRVIANETEQGDALAQPLAALQRVPNRGGIRVFARRVAAAPQLKIRPGSLHRFGRNG